MWHEGLLLKLKSNGISGHLLNLFSDFLAERYQRNVLNGKSSDWKGITARVPQGSVLGPLLFLIYINDLADNIIMSDVKLFADDTSMFNVVFDTYISTEVLNQDLGAVQDWAYQWKMSFNPDPAKQAEQVIYSTKVFKVEHPAIYFCGSEVETVLHHEHIGLILDETLNFAEHLKKAIIKASSGIGIIRFLSKYVYRDVLDQMYKLHMRPYLDYADVVYHNQNSSLMSKLESTQYVADKLFEELGWESLAHRRWYRRLCLFYKIMNNGTLEYKRRYLPTFKKIHMI